MHTYRLSHFDGDFFKKFFYRRGCTSELRIVFKDSKPSAPKNLYIIFPIPVAIIQMHFNNINKSPNSRIFPTIWTLMDIIKLLSLTHFNIFYICIKIISIIIYYLSFLCYSFFFISKGHSFSNNIIFF